MGKMEKERSVEVLGGSLAGVWRRVRGKMVEKRERAG